MSLPFVAVKTHIPAHFQSMVSRLRLVEDLNQCLSAAAHLALVSAPAGAGKTVLLAQWLQQIPANFHAAWLSIDDGDNHLARFMMYLMAALQNATPGLGGDFSALAEATPGFTAEQAVAYLVEQVTDIEENLLLVLDDYHLITSPEVHQAIKLLLDHLPSNLRLVIAGRVEPPIPLARLRARGQLVEIRVADLRFSVAEASQLLARFPDLPACLLQEKLIHRINASMEGWAAGLHMTALAFRAELSRQDERAQGEQLKKNVERLVDELSGSHRYILDYLLEEVLSREAAPISEFLLHTCLLERFNAELCAALAPGYTPSAAQDTLLYLERANLFLVALDAQREWFRYHHLFADVLQKQLLHTHPNLPFEMHSRAAVWFERQGMVDEALAHATCAGNPTLPLDLAEKYALEAILQGRIATASQWLDSLPGEALLSRPRLCLDRAWALTFTSRTEAALPYLARAEALLQEGHGNTQAVRSEVLGLQSFRESMYGHTDEALRLAQLALDCTPAEQSFLQCSNRIFLAGALAHAGKIEDALQEYRAIQPLCQMQTNLAGLALLEADFLHDLAIFLHGRDRIQQAITLLEQAINDLEAISATSRPAAIFLYVGLGKILLLENRLAEAEQSLEKGLRLDPAGVTVSAFDGWIALWRIKLNQGDFPAARRILQQLEQIVQGRDPKVARMVMLNMGLQDLLEGQLDQAVERLERLGLTGDVTQVLTDVSDSEMVGWRINEFFTYARLLIAQGYYSESLKVLERLESAVQDVGVHWMAYRSRIFQAVAHQQAGHLDQALEILKELLTNTSSMQANPARVYLEPGEPARFLLKEAQRRDIFPAHVSALLAGFPSEKSPASPPGLPEALTERELDVLRLMAEGLKNQAIGEKLYISLNTIRYHTTNIFGKLGVDNRTAAVARARQLGIL